jgi:uncharacterized protein (UPF0276 family)
MNRFELPSLGFGIGLRTPHFEDILAGEAEVDWFEILSENFMATGGRPMTVLDRVSERYPIVMHGVSMSIGSTDPIDFDYLAQLKALAERTKARWVSDHLCWTGVSGRNSHDLLPVPYNEETLAHVVDRIRIVQDFMERPLFFENPSTYLEFADSTMSEWQFLTEMSGQADCGLLIDVNNIYVSSFNHGWDPYQYLAGIPGQRVAQYHLAGHTNFGTHIIDSHSAPVTDAVWSLYREALQRFGARSTLLEWDADIPDLGVVVAEVDKARAVATEVDLAECA